MKKNVLKAAVMVLVTLALGSCSKEKFHITGTMSDAKDSVLYFENMSLDGPVVKDSVKLDENGNFEFSDGRAEAPEFYRLQPTTAQSADSPDGWRKCRKPDGRRPQPLLLRGL